MTDAVMRMQKTPIHGTGNRLRKNDFLAIGPAIINEEYFQKLEKVLTGDGRTKDKMAAIFTAGYCVQQPQLAESSDAKAWLERLKNMVDKLEALPKEWRDFIRENIGITSERNVHSQGTRAREAFVRLALCLSNANLTGEQERQKFVSLSLLGEEMKGLLMRSVYDVQESDVHFTIGPIMHYVKKYVETRDGKAGQGGE